MNLALAGAMTHDDLLGFIEREILSNLDHLFSIARRTTS
jgi:hypothetical protein